MLNKDNREKRKRGNPLAVVANFYRLLKVEYRGEYLSFNAVIALCAIHYRNQAEGKPVKWEEVRRYTGHNIPFKYFEDLERLNLIFKADIDSPNLGYVSSIEGEFLIRDVSTNLTRILENRPTNRFKKIENPNDPRLKYTREQWRKRETTRAKARDLATFEDLVKETLYKPGLNQRVKYALLRTLGMKAEQAKQALKSIEHLKNTERIKPVLSEILTTFKDPI